MSKGESQEIKPATLPPLNPINEVNSAELLNDTSHREVMARAQQLARLAGNKAHPERFLAQATSQCLEIGKLKG